MIKTYGKILVVIIGAIIFNGCALNDSTLRLKCNIPDSTVKIDSIKEISIKKFTDARRADDPNFVYYKNNNFGKTQGKLTSEDVTIADFATEVVRKSIEKAGVKIIDNSEFVLSGKILSLDNVARVGFWSVSVESTMQGELQLDRGSQIVRKDAFFEKGNDDGNQVIDVCDYEDSLDKLFKNLSVTVVDFIRTSQMQSLREEKSGGHP